MYPRLLQLGHIAIPTYGALTALGLVAALVLAVRLARRFSLDPNKLWSLCLLGTLTTLIGARLLLALVFFRAFRQHPFWVLGLTQVHAPGIFALAAAAGVGAAVLFALAEGLPVLAVLDTLAPAAALATALNRIGAFLAGLDWGTPTRLGWAVTYDRKLSVLWYGTPTYIPLHPVQLYDAAAALLTLALLLFWLPRRTQPGELAGGWLFLTGFAAAIFMPLRADASPALALPLAAAAVIAGGALWLRRKPVEASLPAAA
ncbi:prolipoprotein diacylglyceryl transferase family protein [Silvibacterium sp.]|uniref:prolipoprotein diacylglyceryl transferase family protein n=1 Tax=Silvibacterium sp. TaxID=1964179 RepID=UPI0039E28BCD